jgi:hypothetical protein
VKQRRKLHARWSIGLSRLVLAILTLWGFAMVVPSLYRIVWPLASLGFSADNDGRVVDTQYPFPNKTDSPAAQAGIVVGDRLDLAQMNCFAPFSQACAAAVIVLGGSGGLQYTLSGQEVDLALLPATGGPLRVVHLRSADAPLDFGERLVLLADTLVSVFAMLAACSLVWARPSVANWGFFLYFLWFNPGRTFTYYALLQQLPLALLAQQIAESLAIGAALGGLLLFAPRFPEEEPNPRWKRWAPLALVIGGLLVALRLSNSANLFGVPTERLTTATFIAQYAVNLLVLAILLRRRRGLHPRNQQRMLWVIAGCALGLSSFLVAEFCTTTGFLENVFGTTPSQTIIGLLYLVQGFFAYFVWTAVRRQRVISVAIPLRHGSLTTALTLVLGVPIVFLHEQIAEIHSALHLPEWIWPLVVAPIILLALQRLHEFAVELADHIFSRSYHATRHRLEHAGHAALQADSFAAIDRSLVEEPVRCMRLTSAAVFREIDGNLLRMEPAVGWGEESQRQLQPRRHAAVIACLKQRELVRLPPGIWRGLGLTEEEQAPCLAVPVFDGAGQPAAIALYGPHETGSDIALDERDMLRTLAEQAGRGYHIVETKTLRQEVHRLRARLAAADP